MNTKVMLALVAGLALSAPAMANDGAALYKSKGCVACHQVDGKGLGPSYKKIAAKYAADKDAVSKLSAKVINGSSGTWPKEEAPGMVMPPHKGRVNDAEAKALIEYVLKQK